MTRVRVVNPFPDLPYIRDDSAWFPPEIESEITTLAAWCQIKQQQREPLSSVYNGQDNLEEALDDEECTNLLGPLTLDSEASIKREFLDRLAELLCYSKNPALITSTALIYSDEEVTVVAARNSSNGQTWLDKDITMLEYLAEVLEQIASNKSFELDPLPAVQSTLIRYYSDRIRHHAKEAMSVVKGDASWDNFKDKLCGEAVSGLLCIDDFASGVDFLAKLSDFHDVMEAGLTKKKKLRLMQELQYIRRPIQGTVAFAHVAQRLPGFRKIKVVLLKSLPARKVKTWKFPFGEFTVTPQLKAKLCEEFGKRKHIHAEMMLMTYLLSSNNPSSEVFPYLGVSKKTCFLCGNMLQEMGIFGTRGNHGKCYSHWTLPYALGVSPEITDKLRIAVERIRSLLRAKNDVPHRDAEKESAIVDSAPPRYEMHETLFNRVVQDPKFTTREAEWFAMIRRRDRKSETNSVGNGSPDNSELIPLVTAASETGSKEKGVQGASLRACAFCKDTRKLDHTCGRCKTAVYCDFDCYQSDWYRHKFSCVLGRPLDATDYLVLACHAKEFPQDDNAVKQYGFMCFDSGKDRARLFELYIRLVVEWGIDEEELRDAVEMDELKEMLIFQCSQTMDSVMLSDMQWLESKREFKAKGEGTGPIALINAAREDLLSPDDRNLPILELDPPAKREALVFYAQIRNGFKPDVDEDNWISCGFCTAANPESEQRLCSAYSFLMERCSFDEFWNAMARSTIVDLFEKYGLADQISRMRNFSTLMAAVSKCHPSVWELKRFTRMDSSDPFRAVVVDYGFMNCENAYQRIQLREMYQKYFDDGQDEMRLHEACIAGELAIFLKSALGSLEVPVDLLSNPYPLENCPLKGMVTKSVIVYPESLSNQLGTPANGAMIFTVPDAGNKSLNEYVYDKASFLGLRLRVGYFRSKGQVMEQMTFY
ncbi:hypothetical protein ANO14919_109590 [Xylariales sp. No.14919]|nr:hypothetical protein ANO14919_109590 [Xylariales sp. No.14919]